jgi:uncharacterized membrane protein
MEHEQQQQGHEKENKKCVHGCPECKGCNGDDCICIKKGSGKNIGMAVVAYILFFIPLLTDAKNDPFVKFHVKQGLVLLLTGFAVSIVGSILPIIGWFIILPLGSLAVLILWIIGILNAVSGKEKELPLVGSLAKHFTF